MVKFSPTCFKGDHIPRAPEPQLDSENYACLQRRKPGSGLPRQS
ncbi:hypothetical protein LINPERPRIM_LOCUS19833 [Linum perenne]